MPNTLHQAMAYLGLKENDHERSGRAARRPQPTYQNDETYEDEAFYPYEEAPLAEETPASFASTEERDVLLGILKEPARPAAYREQEAPAYAHTVVEEAPQNRWEEQPAAPDYREREAQPARQQAPHITPLTSDESDSELRRITTIHPRSYNDAKIIGESFRENIPVIMNVTDMGDTEAKRLVDFSAGLAFALHGSIERVTDKVFLLTPANLEVLGAEGSEVPVALDSDDTGLFNQG